MYNTSLSLSLSLTHPLFLRTIPSISSSTKHRKQKTIRAHVVEITHTHTHTHMYIYIYIYIYILVITLFLHLFYVKTTYTSSELKISYPLRSFFTLFLLTSNSHTFRAMLVLSLYYIIPAMLPCYLS